MDYQSKFEFDSPVRNSAGNINNITENLASVSTDEIKSFFNRVNFYLEHYSIIGKKSHCDAADQKVNFLKKLNTVLKNEIDNRKTVKTY